MDMRTELESVLASSVFARSPVQARLLTYLVEASIDGRGKELKSYSLAVEALGKSPDFDSQADSYARVQVGRVRNSLDNFYSSEGVGHNQRLSIEAGSYEVRLVPNEQAKTADRPSEGHRLALPKGKPGKILVLGAAAAALAVAAAIAAFLGMYRPVRADVWNTDDFPSVEVAVHAKGNSPGAAEIADIIHDLVVVGLNNFESLSVSSGHDSDADYRIEISISSDRDAALGVVSFIEDRRRHKLVWSDEEFYPRNDPGLRSKIDETYTKFPFFVGHATGLIHSNERKYIQGYMTPYGCWLLFSSLVYNQRSGDDEQLAECSEDWYSQVPNHPLAAALYGWSLTDSSFYRLTEAGRKETLGKAMTILQNARGLHPNSAFVEVSTIKVFAYAGERKAMIALAERAIREHPDNLDVLGFSGLMLTLQNEPGGEAMIKQAIARHFNPPPWYFVGLAVGAMMRDDDREAAQALRKLSDLNHALALRPVLAAASEAHAGQLEKARASWAEAKANQPVLSVNSDLFFARLPVAPEVRKKLKEWLAPVI